MRLRVHHPDNGDFAGKAIEWGILNATARCLTTPLREADLSPCVLLRPYSLACLAAMACAAPEPPVLHLPDDERCCEHLLRMGLDRFFTVATHPNSEAPRRTNVPIERIDGMPGDFADRAIDLWADEIGELPAGLAYDLKDHLDEVIRNALGHAASPIGCVVAGQAFPKRGLVEVAVVDLGQSIRTHLSQHPDHRDIKDDRAAIERATEEGVTGTVGVNALNEPNSGEGLYRLKVFAAAGCAEMTILSGSRMIVFGREGIEADHPFYGSRFGCLVNIRFFTSFPLPAHEDEAIVF